MSNRCPHCGAPAGRAHEPCPYAPGGKFSKEPARRQPPGADEIKAVSTAALSHQKPKPSSVATVPLSRHESAQPVKFGDDETPQPEVEGGKRKKLASHPDCQVCAANREKARMKMRKMRGETE